MFHVKPEHVWSRASHWAGVSLGEREQGSLHVFREWLLDEAVEAGGLGPNEGDRVDNRHIGDSLLFAAGLDASPTEVLDVGSGVGLPGIPLAIVLPDTKFVLLDRSGRRVDLMRRATRVLELPNIEVVHGDIADWARPVDAIVSRASLLPEQAGTIFKRLLTPTGRAVVGGSWVSKPDVEGFDLLEVPATVLDHRVWLLIMRPQ